MYEYHSAESIICIHNSDSNKLFSLRTSLNGFLFKGALVHAGDVLSL